MAEVLRRLEKSKLTTEEFEYVSDLYQYEGLLAIKDAEFDKAAKKAEEKLKAELKAEREKFQAELRAKLKAEREKFQAELRTEHLRAIKKLLLRGDSIASIADLLSLSIEETQALVNQIEAKKP